jgi:hypothetical protein
MAKKKKCSSFEEMLMWTSYRYCIGRHTYVTSLAGEMAQNYYDRLDDERLEFTANDIRREIYDKLQWLPFKFEIHRMYNDDPLNPIEALMTFIDRVGINDMKQFLSYSNIEYDVHNDKFNWEKKNPTIKSYFSISDIEDLLPWADLASCFDKKNHKMVTLEYEGELHTYRCFKSWRRSTVPCEDKPGWCRMSEFGWDSVWVSVDDYVKTGKTDKYLNTDYIKEINEI